MAEVTTRWKDEEGAGVRGIRVLVVEDEYLIAQQAVDLLADAGCTVVGPVATLEKALRAASRERFDVALLDINLCGEEVFALAEVLRRQHVPFVFVTGYSQRVVPQHMAGMMVIGKPFTQDSLVTAILTAVVRPPLP